MEKPILDPSIPYIGPIYGGRFAPGKMVRIQGTSPSIAYRFNINLQCGSETIPRDDVAVQVAVRYLDGYISINSLQSGIWGEEQRGASLPIKRAEQFEIIISCDFNQYKIAINGQHYSEFPQRIHYDRISHLAIDGDVSIVRITYESISPGGFGAASSSGIGVIAGSGAGASAPVSLSGVEPQDADFEMIDSTHTSRPPQPVIRPVPDIGFAHPPSYEAATGGPPYPSGGAPYPTGSAPYPTGGAPYPTGSAPYPTGGAPYPTGGAPYPTPYLANSSGMGPGIPPGATPYPTGVPGFIGGSPLPPPGAPGIPPPPPGAPIPLNAASSNFYTAKRSYGPQCWKVCLGVVIGLILIIAIVTSKVFKSRSRHTSHTSDSYGSRNSYDGNSYNSYGSNSYGSNSYGSNSYSSNNYGGYNSDNYWHRD